MLLLCPEQGEPDTSHGFQLIKLFIQIRRRQHTDLLNHLVETLCERACVLPTDFERRALDRYLTEIRQQVKVAEKRVQQFSLSRIADSHLNGPT